MDLKEQKYVCALAECRNLTKAAEKLYISQPALSIFLANLERNLGVALFERRGKQLMMTYAGEKYVETARKMLGLELEFKGELNDILIEKAGRIRLGVPQRRAPWLIPPVVAKYKRIYPGIKVSIFDGNLAYLNGLLKDFELDLIIGNKADMAPEMETELLFQEEFLLAVSAFSPLNEKSQYVPGEKYRKIKPECLDGQDLILHTSWESSRVLEDKIIKKHNIKPASVQIIRGTELLLQLVAEGLGTGFVREGFTTHLHYDKPLNYYTLDTEKHLRSVVVAYKKGKELPGYMKAMIELLKEQARL